METMYDYALFIARSADAEPRRLRTIETAISGADEKAIAHATTELRKAAAMWRANYEPFALANFTIRRSPHGKNDFRLLLKV